MPTKKPLIGAAIVGQSGGPSSVINASAYGVIKTALEDENITKVYGAEHGIVGVLEDRLMIMDEEDPAELERLLYTPSSALGSCRYKIADPSDNDKDYKRILEIFEKYNVRYFFYIGGNDSMDTCAKISRYMAKVGYECRVIGVPKATVLPAAKGDGPDLIYLPEVDFDMADFLDDVIRVYEGQGQCLVAVSEGIHYSDGAFVSEAKTSSTDGFGHAQLGGLAHRLAGIVSAATGAKVRGIELSLLQRCAAHCASATDIEEAFQCGKVAVESALRGETGKMVGMVCKRDGGYSVSYELFDLRRVANAEKKIPLEWITSDNAYVTDAFIDYCTPLLEGQTALGYEDGLPRFARLKKVFAK